MFAEAVRQSVKAGYGGCVAFMAKSNLVDYYKKICMQNKWDQVREW